ADAVVFAHKRLDWLEGQLAAIPPARPPQPGGTVLYRGCALTIAWEQGRPRTPEVSGETLVLGGPAETVPTRIRRWLEREALRLCAQDLAHYCARAGLAEPQLRRSRALRRCGSCSGNGCIRINWRLVQAPDPVRRTVVAHEVAHRTHSDHSPAVQAFLGRLSEGDPAAADDWLKREG